MAQEGASPPVVMDETPVLPGGAAATEALPTLPGAADAVLPAPEAKVDTDLVTLVRKAHPVVQAVMAGPPPHGARARRCGRPR